MNFLPLHVYSGFSYLRSGWTLGRYLSVVKKRGLSYAPITDFQTLSGYPELTHSCLNKELKPVYGYEMEVEGDFLSLYVTNEEGYKNLLHIVYLVAKGEVDRKEVVTSCKGLIPVLDMGRGSIKEKINEDFKGVAEYLQKHYGHLDNLYLGLPYGDIDYVEKVREFASIYPFPLLAFPLIRYEKKDGALTVAITNAIAEGKNIDLLSLEGEEYFLSDEEASAYFKEEEINNCYKIAEEASCFVFIQKRGNMPVFPNPLGVSSEEYLRLTASKGLEEKVPNHDAKYAERLEHELEVIVKLGYADYFLLVADYVGYAKANDIYVGPGRGSAVGSLVAYCLNITSIDPLKYDLLFERFLNPDRASMPDIDVDFLDRRRDEVVSYLQEKYGVDKVAHILAISTIGPKAAIQDIGRVYGYQEGQIRRMSNAIARRAPSGYRNTLADNYRFNKEFRSLVDSDEYYRTFASLARRIEGLPRQATMHAAGIIMNKDPLQEEIPINIDEHWGYIVQYENESENRAYHYLEEQGFLKMDLLGLTNLALVERCLNLIEHYQGIKLDYETLPYEDKKGIGLIAANKTQGLFQLESAGMNGAIRQIKPTSFEDVVALLALYRPGPMESIPSYGKRKEGKEKVNYLDPCLEEILSSTYGIIVYQEQIMLIATKMAGFSLAEADSFRRAISKKDSSVLGGIKDQFIQGCVANGHKEEIAIKVFDLIARFAEYGFNKSHAVGYAKLSCQMAYLKAYYPKEFYCAALYGQSSGSGKFASYYSEMRQGGISFLLPSIDKSDVYYSPDEKGIRIGLSCIKDVSEKLALDIVDERKKGGFKDFPDFVKRVYPFGLTLENLCSLIDSGALDELGYSRASLRSAAPAHLHYASIIRDEEDGLSLAIELPAPIIQEISETIEERLSGEMESLGMMVSGSPLFRSEDKIKELGAKKLFEATTSKGEILVAGIIRRMKKITTKKGDHMAFISLFDEDYELEATVFSENYEKYFPLLKEGNMVAVRLIKDRVRDNSYIVNEVIGL